MFTTTTQTPQGQAWLSVNDPTDRRKLDMVRNLTPRATINARVWHGLTLSDSEPLRIVFEYCAGGPESPLASGGITFGRGDDTVGNPHRAQISQFELFELILLLKLDKQFPVEQFEATVSQSTVPSPPLRYVHHVYAIYLFCLPTK